MNKGPADTRRPGRNTRRWLLAGLAAALVLLVALAAKVLLLLFAAILVAVFLRALSSWVSRHTPLGHGWALAVVLITLLGSSGLGGWLLAPRLSEQVQRFTAELPKAWEAVQKQVREAQWGEPLRRFLPSLQKLGQQSTSALSKASAGLFSTFGVLADFVILVIVGIYLAAEPRRYVGGVVRLFPPEHRERTGQIMETLGQMLQRWLVGRVVLMVTNAIATTVGLWALGVPLPVILGILSGLLNFIPNFGPIIAAVPAVLLAFVKGPWTALYVLLFYFAYQMLDGYLFTPLVERRTVALPPALTILAQVLLGVLLGGMGVLLAVPIAAVFLVIVKMVYIEDILGEKVSVPGRT
jgi:predicted PurR-regulated permease PerM